MNLSGSLFNMKRMNFIDALRHAITDPGNYTRKMTFTNEFRYFKTLFCFIYLHYLLQNNQTVLNKQFSSDFDASRKRYEEEYKREHVLGMDIHLKTYKEILKESDSQSYVAFIFTLQFLESIMKSELGRRENIGRRTDCWIEKCKIKK